MEYFVADGDPRIEAALLLCDQLVHYWRKRREEAIEEEDTLGIHTAACYIDAYKSMKHNLKHIQAGEVTLEDILVG